MPQKAAQKFSRLLVLINVSWMISVGQILPCSVPLPASRKVPVQNRSAGEKRPLSGSGIMRLPDAAHHVPNDLAREELTAAGNVAGPSCAAGVLLVECWRQTKPDASAS